MESLNEEKMIEEGGNQALLISLKPIIFKQVEQLINEVEDQNTTESASEELS